MSEETLLWVDKYRPKTIEACILPDRIKKSFLNFRKDDNFPNLLLTGGPGTGKTSVARALCADLGYDSILINASDERNIEVVRTTIKEFASHMSLSGNKKCIILDEADGLNPLSAQPALRAAIEEFSTSRFILTCNYKNRLIEPIHSRTATIDFNLTKAEKQEILPTVLGALFSILKQENVKYEQLAVANLVKKYFPDVRRIIGELQMLASGGVIDEKAVNAATMSKIADLVNFVKDKDVGKAREWIVHNLDNDPQIIYRQVYDEFYKAVKPDSIPALISIIGNRIDDSTRSFDQEITMMSMIADMLREGVEFK